jgi:hypothetical protein
MYVAPLCLLYDATSFYTIIKIWWWSLYKSIKAEKWCEIILNCHIVLQHLDEMVCLQDTEAILKQLSYVIILNTQIS